MFATLKAKIIAGGVVALIVLAAFLAIKGLVNDRASLRDWQTTVLQATQDASHNKKLVARDVAGQVKILGDTILNFKQKIAVQNDAVASLEEKRKEALAAGDREAALRKEVIEQSQSLAKELRGQALTPVKRENLEAELRRVQDVAWEAGL